MAKLHRVPTIMEHQNRIKKQFMILDYHYSPENYTEFITKRTMWQDKGLTSFLDSLINANWDSVEADYEISEEITFWSNGPLGLERNFSMYILI